MKELRIGLVLYGGVSLAIYINGVTTEVWNLLVASKANSDKTGNSVSKLSGTAKVFSDLLSELEKDRKFHDLRVVVDAVAGTSAGGVNGVALAKAIVDGGDMSDLNDVWIEKADISKLGTIPEKAAWWKLGAVNIAASVSSRVANVRKQIEALPGLTWQWVVDQGFGLLSKDNPVESPLDGFYFSKMIADTFLKMNGSKGQFRPLLPGESNFDLFVTCTDFYGWPRHLPVSRQFHPEALYERTHAHRLHFFQQSSGNGFDDDFGLTFAARATAGFPVAFPAVNKEDAFQAYSKAQAPITPNKPTTFIDSHLREHKLAGYDGERAWMVDGGLLDNKPFTYVTKAIEKKTADRQVYRTVIYVEPDPEGEVEQAGINQPKAKDVIGGLFGLFRHEPVFQDLRELQARNSKVERIRDIVAVNTFEAIARLKKKGVAEGIPWPPQSADEINKWRILANEFALNGNVSGFAGYTALKARRAAEKLADLICNALKYPAPSRHAYVVRQVVRVWLDMKGALSPPEYNEERGVFEMNDAQLGLLRAFDHAFRLRRLRSVVYAINREYEIETPETSDHRRDLDLAKDRIGKIIRSIESLSENNDAELRDVIRVAFDNIVPDAGIDEIVGSVNANPAEVAERFGEVFESIYAGIRNRMSAVIDGLNNDLFETISQVPASHGSFNRVAEAFVAFPVIDVAVYPILDSASITELYPVQVMRVSPHDSTCLTDDQTRLKGRELGAFAGFLDREAREHDLVWGRLDACERLLDLVLSAATDGKSSDLVTQKRNHFLSRLFNAVLEEENARGNSQIEVFTTLLVEYTLKSG